MVRAAGGPGDQGGPQGAAVLQGPGEHVAAQAQLVVLVLVHAAGDDETQVLVAHGGDAEHGGQNGDHDQLERRFDLLNEAAQQGLHRADLLEDAAEAHGDDHQVVGPEHAVHAAPVQ